MDDTFKDCIIAARAELQKARSLLQAEISSYPTPISGCDAQFNHLIGEREKVISALGDLNRLVFVPTPRSPYRDAGVESR